MNNIMVNKVNQEILELKNLLNKDYLDKLNNKEQEELYDSLVELIIPLFDYSYLKDKQFKKRFVNDKVWSAWRKTRDGEKNNN